MPETHVLYDGSGPPISFTSTTRHSAVVIPKNSLRKSTSFLQSQSDNQTLFWNVDYDKFHPNLYVDISDFLDVKLKALACHASQIADFPGVEARVRERSAEIGAPKGYAYAEAFDRLLMPR